VGPDARSCSAAASISTRQHFCSTLTSALLHSLLCCSVLLDKRTSALGSGSGSGSGIVGSYLPCPCFLHMLYKYHSCFLQSAFAWSPLCFTVA
jgi:hypothetical protein